MTLRERLGEKKPASAWAYEIGQSYTEAPEIRELSQAERWLKRGLELISEDDRPGRAKCLAQLGRVAWVRFNEARRGDRPDAITRPFSDIARSVHLPAILALSDSGVMNGCGDGRFCPNTAVDRAEMAQVLWRALRLPAATADAFSDDDGLPAEPAINALAAAGVVNGCGDGTRYCPDEPVTRARMAAYLARGFALAPATGDVFADDDGHGHEDSINRLAASGITLGCTPTRFCVTGKVTRGQLASFLVRALDR